MAAPKRKVICTCAVTGGIHTPTRSQAVPYRPADIAAHTERLCRPTETGPEGC